MSLPIYQTSSKDLSLLQTQWSSQINPVLNQPISQGSILQNVLLTTGSNIVNHKLGRKLQGWFVVRQSSAANIYDDQDNNAQPQVSLILVSDADVSVNLFVF